MTAPPLRLLVNPAAGRGRALRQLDTARHALARVGPFDVVETTSAGDEARLATEAVQDGVRTLAVLGGDGTVSRVAAALVRAREQYPGSDTALAVLGAGTGNDFAKSLGAPTGDLAAMAECIARRRTQQIDMGSVNGTPFVNAAGFGFDVAVLERTTRARWLRGDAVYLSAALAELFRFPGFTVRIGAESSGKRRLMIVIANGQWFGGMFRIAPSARINDGLLDLVAIGDVPAWRRARLFAAAPAGGHVALAGVEQTRTREVTLTFDAPVQFEADGELHALGSRECTVRVMPGALSCVV